MPWRAEDECLLQRLEDETLVEALVSSFAGDVVARLPPRAAGLVAVLRTIPAGAEAVRAGLAGDSARIADFVRDLPLADCPPVLLHHLALFFGRVAVLLADKNPEAAADAWTRSLDGWLALADERTYLASLAECVLGNAREAAALGLAPERVPLSALAEIESCAIDSAHELGSRGRAAMLALSRVGERLRGPAMRARNAAIESALAVIVDGLEEASARGDLVQAGRGLLLRALPVWSWTSHDAAVEHFVVDRITPIGWDLYRARTWGPLRELLEPFRPLFEHLAHRIERGPGEVAYAAGCAQMFVFMSEVARSATDKVEFAERAVAVCPTHRNGRLVLAAALCERAIDDLRSMMPFVSKTRLDRVEALLVRAESLYPQAGELAEAKRLLDRVRKR
jgi:hypothetical protein